MAGSIRKQGKNSWGVQIELGRDPVSKRRRFHRFTVHGTKKDAERAVTAALAERDQGLAVVPSKVTIEEYMSIWLRDFAEHNVAASTLVRYREIIELHIIPALGHIRLADLRPTHVQAAYGVWLRPGGRRDGKKGALSERTVLHHHRVLHEALNWAVKWQFLSRNPCDAVAAPRPDRPEMHALDALQAKKLLEAASDEPLYAFFHTAVTTGARLGELLALHWRDVDFDNSTLRISWSLRRFADRGIVFGRPKTDRSRRLIGIDADTKRSLQDHRRRQIEQRLLVGPAYEDSDLVFANPLGQPMGDSTVRTTFQRILGRAGLPKVRIHDLRHTSATLWVENGHDPRMVADRLGHTTVSMTLNNYVHGRPEAQIIAAEAIASMIR